jgi:hypothetical protein
VSDRNTKISDGQEISIIPKFDFTMKDMEMINKFKDDGMLGIASLDTTNVERSMALYLDGKTYRQIANVLKINKSIILFLAHKYSWYELREQYLEELKVTIPNKILEHKLQSQEFLLELSQAYRKKIAKNVHQYLRTDDPKYFEKNDAKDVTSWLKIEEMIYSTAEHISRQSEKSMVGLNGLGEGMTITKTGANSIEITPKGPSPFGSKLKAFAELKREQERANAPEPKPAHDIVKENENPTKKEKEDEVK